MDNRNIQSNVQVGKSLYLVSSILRSYGPELGEGVETMVWEIDPMTRKRLRFISQSEGLKNHFRAVEDLFWL